jgi:hypothetical protein
MTHQEAVAALRERFDAEGVTEIVEWEDRTAQELIMRYGYCYCGQTRRSRLTWTLSDSGEMNGRMDLICASGHGA